MIPLPELFAANHVIWMERGDITLTLMPVTKPGAAIKKTGVILKYEVQ